MKCPECTNEMENQGMDLYFCKKCQVQFCIMSHLRIADILYSMSGKIPEEQAQATARAMMEYYLNAEKRGKTN